MKKILNYLILILLLGVTLRVLVGNDEIANLPQLLINTNKLFLFMAFICMVLYWFFEAYIIHKMKKTLNIKGTYGSALKLCMIGQYYSAITPFSTGGQPVQIYSMVSDGVPVGTASSLFVNRFLIYQLVVTFYSVIMFIVRFNLIYEEASFALSFVVIGCIINVLVLIAIVGFVLNEKFIKTILNKLLFIGYKIKLIKDMEKSKEKINKTLVDYKNSIEEMKRNKKTTIELIFVSFMQLTIAFSITYFVYLALGLRGVHFLDIIALQSLHYMAVSFMPTPGTAGAAEGGFYMLFRSVFPKKILSFAVLLWRFIDYYLRVLITGFVTLADFISRKRRLSID